ncbi:hypothetical protein ACFT2C_05935 [Promicromonospora sp. NPDC057138]|uniref:hypothetical protein n=1 Tax=Promicromonospora sp. NPDC057138 TaxID=3346031 RepID=UPI0036261489
MVILRVVVRGSRCRMCGTRLATDTSAVLRACNSAHPHDMTTTDPKRGMTIAQYDAARRADARDAGTPMRRTRAPGIFGQGGAVGGSVDDVGVWADGRGTLRTCLLGEPGRSARLTARLLDKALVMPEKDKESGSGVYPDLERPRRLVVPDDATMRRVIGAAEAWARRGVGTGGAGDMARSLPFRLHLALGLVASTRVVVLTRALSRSFWLPAGLDGGVLASWQRAFGVPPSEGGPGLLGYLAKRARDGSTSTTWAGHAFRSESAALTAARFRGLRAAVTVYGRAAAADAATRAILTADPLLLERGTLDGTVSRLRMLNLYEDSFTASVSLPFRLRPGKQVLLVDPRAGDGDEWVETTLLSVHVETVAGRDLVTVRVAGATRKGRLSRLIETVAQRPARELYVMDAPYLPFRTDTLATRWTQRAEARRAGDAALGLAAREVPLDVLIAGAPEEGLAIVEK